MPLAVAKVQPGGWAVVVAYGTTERAAAYVTRLASDVQEAIDDPGVIIDVLRRA